MSTLTKEWLQKTIAELEEERDAVPGAVNEDSAMSLAAMKRALASLEAEAVAYIFKHPAGRLFWSLIDERNKGQGDVMPVYSAPVPTFVPPAIEPDYEVIKGILPTANPDEYACCIAAGWNACRAAMLQGSQPVSNRDELPVIGWLRSDYNSDDKRDPNAPLFMLGSNDPSEAWGVKYIPLSGNSPVAPDGWVACSERMPEEDTYNVVADIGSEGNIYGAAAAWFIHGNFSPMDGISASNYDGGASIEIDMHISHWMPLKPLQIK